MYLVTTYDNYSSDFSRPISSFCETGLLSLLMAVKGVRKDEEKEWDGIPWLDILLLIKK